MRKITRIVTEKGKDSLGDKAEYLLIHALRIGTLSGQYSQHPCLWTHEAIQSSLSVIDDDAHERGVEISEHRHNILSSNKYFAYPETENSTQKCTLSVCFYYFSFVIMLCTHIQSSLISN